MDPNILAVNSVISSRLTSSFAEGKRLHAAVLRTLDGVCLDDAVDFHHDIRPRVLSNLDSIPFWYRLGVHDKRLGRV